LDRSIANQILVREQVILQAADAEYYSRAMLLNNRC
jgi:hypothetical protein